MSNQNQVRNNGGAVHQQQQQQQQIFMINNNSQTSQQQQQVVFRQNSNNNDNYQQQHSISYQDNNGKIYDVISDGSSVSIKFSIIIYYRNFVHIPYIIDSK